MTKRHFYAACNLERQSDGSRVITPRFFSFMQFTALPKREAHAPIYSYVGALQSCRLRAQSDPLFCC